MSDFTQDEDLLALMRAAATVMKQEYIATWLMTPLPALEGERPLDLMRRRDYQPLFQVIAQLQSPGST